MPSRNRRSNYPYVGTNGMLYRSKIKFVHHKTVNSKVGNNSVFYRLSNCLPLDSSDKPLTTFVKNRVEYIRESIKTSMDEGFTH